MTSHLTIQGLVHAAACAQDSIVARVALQADYQRATGQAETWPAEYGDLAIQTMNEKGGEHEQ